MVVIRCFSILCGCLDIDVTRRPTPNHITVENPSSFEDLNLYCTYIRPDLFFTERILMLRRENNLQLTELGFEFFIVMTHFVI